MDFVRCILHDDEPGAEIFVRLSAIRAVRPLGQDTFGEGGGYPYCELLLGETTIRVLGTADEVLTASPITPNTPKGLDAEEQGGAG